MCEALARGEELPFDPTDATIYYVGPTPAKPGQVIGSAGPTTSGRMDAYAPTMMSVGARGMIGKGARLPEVVDAMKKYSGVYFGAIGGAGALLAKCIKEAELVAFEDLGAEALRRLYVEDMPLVVIIDSEGKNLYIKLNLLHGILRPASVGQCFSYMLLYNIDIIKHRFRFCYYGNIPENTGIRQSRTPVPAKHAVCLPQMREALHTFVRAAGINLFILFFYIFCRRMKNYLQSIFLIL